VPLPVLVPDSTVSHQDVVEAVQAQPGVVNTRTLPTPSLKRTLSLVGEIEYVQRGGAGGGGAGESGGGGGALAVCVTTDC
jgi:hypothetical protein